MRKTLFTLSCLSALAGCAIVVVPDGETHAYSVFDSGTVGDGQTRTETRDFAGASHLNVSGSVSVSAEQGPVPALYVEADGNLLGKVRTETSGDTLRVWVDGSYRTSNGIHVRLVTPQIGSIALNGSGKVNVRGLNGGALSASNSGSGQIRLDGHIDMFDAQLRGSGSVDASSLKASSATVDLTGSGQLDLGNVSGNSLSASVHGSGELRASGAVNSLVAKTYGSGNISLSALTAQTADLETHGSGDISVTVTHAVSASSTGSGDITVYGNPSERNLNGKNIRITG